MVGAQPPVPAAPPLVVEGLRVRYGAFTAVQGLSMTVRPGEIYGLLGSNGAGKSSTIRCIVGLQKRAEGRIGVFGLDPEAQPVPARRLVGYVPETTLLYDALSPREFLEFVSNVRGLEAGVASDRAMRYVRAFDFGAEFDQPLATLSNGTRQKVLLIAALLHQPPLLVLDEPLNNLDPRTVRIMKELLLGYVAAPGRGILLSTHTMEIAQQLCTRVGILDRGTLRGEGTLGGLREQIARGDATLEEIYLRLTDSERAVAAAVQDLRGG